MLQNTVDVLRNDVESLERALAALWAGERSQ